MTTLQTKINKLWSQIDAVWPATDPKNIALRAEVAQEATLESQYDMVQYALDDLRDRKRQRMENLMRKIDPAGLPPPPPPSSTPTTSTTTILENKSENHKKELGRKYLAEVGGHQGYKTSASFSGFLHNANLPTMYESRLTAIVNENPFSVKCHHLVKHGTPTASQFTELGEQVYAEHCSKLFVLYASYVRDVVDLKPWADESLLDANIEEQLKLLTSLAMRDASGLALDTRTPSVGDIFRAEATTATAKKDTQQQKKPLAEVAGNAKDGAVWHTLEPKGLKYNSRCTLCKGWGHKDAQCPKGTAAGNCSRCHGKGHYVKDCSSAVK